jgi:glycolate oxidase
VASFSDAGILPVALELLDHASINAIEDHEPSGLPREARALLIIEVDGLRETVAREAEIVGQVCAASGAVQFEAAESDAAGQAIWEVRRKLSPAVKKTGVRKINEDVVVPRSRIPELMAFIEQVGNRYGFPIPTFGHAGDGNLHVNVMLQRDDAEERELGELAVREIFERSVALGGTISGEHGIGYAKAPYLDIALSASTIELMKTIKAAMDPHGVLNPGKMFT